MALSKSQKDRLEQIRAKERKGTATESDLEYKSLLIQADLGIVNYGQPRDRSSNT